MKPKTSKPIGVNPKVDVKKKYADRVRHGKTAKDKGNKRKG
jgi:hypothetical protein